MEVMRLNKEEKWYLVLGCLTTILIGGIQVVYAVTNAEIYDVGIFGFNLPDFGFLRVT